MSLADCINLAIAICTAAAAVAAVLIQFTFFA